ncbi:MAG: zinc metallopeptidase [Thermoguttaceae bacterium]|nr:zinc metallopeptidase [Thermoguttaceae bacterium]MBQ2621645.1 zinc metallopeptidase [Thermoguttaceae bacterium]
MENSLLYLIVAGVPALIGMLAQGWLKSAVTNGQNYKTSITGAEAARQMLDANGLQHVRINKIDGFLTDHYNPSDKTLNLSADIHDGYTATAVGVACHEAGHAVQDGTHYAPLVVRNLAVPMANIGSNIGLALFAAGLGVQQASQNTMLAWIGLGLFAFVSFFQLINLPVEYNASARGKVFLNKSRIVSGDGVGLVRSALYAAALTYVAATVQAVAQLLYLFTVMQSRSRRE